jgi:RNA polymerase sigma-70 factor (ECF subfamily)
MASEPTDVELVREVLAGRVERFELLVRRYQRLVATAALRMGTPRQEVEEVCNEVFYKVFRSLKSYRPTHALSTWMYRITVNTALDRRRVRRYDSCTDEIPENLKDDRPSPLESTDERERADLLREAVRRLPSHYRAPLVLVHVEGLAVEEAAYALKLPEGTVKSRLFRARAMLKKIIQKHYGALVPAGASGDSQ